MHVISDTRRGSPKVYGARSILLWKSYPMLLAAAATNSSQFTIHSDFTHSWSGCDDDSAGELGVVDCGAEPRKLSQVLGGAPWLRQLAEDVVRLPVEASSLVSHQLARRSPVEVESLLCFPSHGMLRTIVGSRLR